MQVISTSLYNDVLCDILYKLSKFKAHCLDQWLTIKSFLTECLKLGMQIK